jgi:hypothetical protein
MPIDQFLGANNADFTVSDVFTWIATYHTTANVPDRTSNQVVSDTAAANNDPIYTADVDLTTADMSVSTKIGSLWAFDGTNAASGCPAARCNNTGANGGACYYLDLGYSAGVWTLFLNWVTGGAFQAVLASAVIAGDIFTLEIRGNTLNGKMNGQIIIQPFTDNNLKTGTRGGFTIKFGTGGVSKGAIDQLWLNEDPYLPGRRTPRAPSRKNPTNPRRQSRRARQRQAAANVRGY